MISNFSNTKSDNSAILLDTGSQRSFILTELRKKLNLPTIPNRSSHRMCSVRKDVLRNFAKSTEKHLRRSIFFNKVADLNPATLLKKRLWHRCFPVNFVKFLRTPFLQNTSGRLLLSEGKFLYKLFGKLESTLNKNVAIVTRNNIAWKYVP